MARPGYGGDFTQDRELKPRFTGDELETLWRRFEPLDDMLKAPGGGEYVPGYQSGPMSYRFESLPAEITLEASSRAGRGPEPQAFIRPRR